MLPLQDYPCLPLVSTLQPGLLFLTPNTVICPDHFFPPQLPLSGTEKSLSSCVYGTGHILSWLEGNITSVDILGYSINLSQMSRTLPRKEYLCYMNDMLKTSEELGNTASHPGSSESFVASHNVLSP